MTTPDQSSKCNLYIPTLISLSFMKCLDLKWGCDCKVHRCVWDWPTNRIPPPPPPLSAGTRSGAAGPHSLCLSSTATAWAAFSSSSPVPTRAAGRSCCGVTWRHTLTTVSTGSSRATWAAALCSRSAPAPSTTATRSCAGSTRPNSRATAPSPPPCRGRWGRCRTRWRTWRGRSASSARAWRSWTTWRRWTKLRKWLKAPQRAAAPESLETADERKDYSHFQLWNFPLRVDLYIKLVCSLARNFPVCFTEPEFVVDADW